MVQVHGCKPGIGSEECKIVTGVVAHDDPATGQVWMVHIHQAILVPDLQVVLLGEMQVRDNGVQVNDTPKHTAVEPTNSHHFVFIPKHEHELEGHDELLIPLRLKGVTSHFSARKPTLQ